MGSSQSLNERHIDAIHAKVGDLLKLEIVFQSHDAEAFYKKPVPERLHKRIVRALMSKEMLHYLEEKLNLEDYPHNLSYPFGIKLLSNNNSKVKVLMPKGESFSLYIDAKMVPRKIKSDDENELTTNLELFMRNAQASLYHDDNASGYVNELIAKSVPEIKSPPETYISFHQIAFVNTDTYIPVLKDTWY